MAKRYHARELEAVEDEMMRRIFKQRRENHPRNDIVRALGGTQQISLNSEVARLINKVRIARNDHSFAHSISKNAELSNAQVTQGCNIATQSLARQHIRYEFVCVRLGHIKCKA